MSSSSKWSTAAVIVGIVATGIVVAGLLNDPEPDAVSIPGCDEVVRVDEQVRVNYAFARGGQADVSSWLTESKADAMTTALAESLPKGFSVVPDSDWPPLVFEPMRGSETGYEAAASGQVTTGGGSGLLSVRVSQSDLGPGPCFEGLVDERRTLADGTTVDIADGRVAAYAPDGSTIDVSGDDLFTSDQLISIATTPGLRVGDR